MADAQRPGAATTLRVVVIGLGNAMRGDDAAGLEAARRLVASLESCRAAMPEVEVRELERETLALLEAWEGADAVILVDAVRSGAAPGTIHRVDASSQVLPAQLQSSSSTHAMGVGEAIELARALRRLPTRVVLLGVEARRFDAGAGLSDEVEAALEALVECVKQEARELLSD